MVLRGSLAAKHEHAQQADEQNARTNPNDDGSIHGMILSHARRAHPAQTGNRNAACIRESAAVLRCTEIQNTYFARCPVHKHAIRAHVRHNTKGANYFSLQLGSQHGYDGWSVCSRRCPKVVRGQADTQSQVTMTDKVILADDHSVFRWGAARILATEGFRVAGQCEDFQKLAATLSTPSGAVTVLASSLQPNISEVLNAISQPARMFVIILENEESADPLVRLGVGGILYRDVASAELVRCVRRVAMGQTYVQQRGAKSSRPAAGERVRNKLTAKELKIVGLILQGYKNREIALELQNSEQVIKNHLRSIFDKTGVPDRLGLAVFAMHHKGLASAATAASASNFPNAQISQVFVEIAC